MIVVDATALVDFLLDKPEAVALVSELSGEVPAHAPELIDLECLNTLRRMVRHRLVTEAEGDAAARDLDDARIVRYRHRLLRDRVWELRYDLSSYDASYLAPAEALPGSILVTGDAGLYEVASASLGVDRIRHIP